MEIQITSLKKVYGKKAPLDGITFSVGNGMFGLIGRNGAGKTTLMRILATLSRPSGGQVTFDGIPLEDTKKIRSFIGYLPQEFSLYPDMSVLEVMRYLAALSGIPGEVWRERIPKLLQQVNLWDDRTKKAGKLSGGMKRRLGIAQALLNDPQVLIVDEPTAGLDPEERLRFYTMLDEFSSSRTVVVSSHIMSDIEAVCDNMAVLDAGRLLFAGTVGALAKKAEGKVLPTVLLVMAMGLFLTILTETYFGVLIAGLFWLAGRPSIGKIAGGNYDLFDLVIRHNTLKGYGRMMENIHMLVLNRVFISSMAFVLLALSVVVYEARRKGVGIFENR